MTLLPPALRPNHAMAGLAFAALLALTGCAAATSDGSATDPGTPAESVPAAAAPETACPAGFVEAYATASAYAFDTDLVVTEASVEDFEPDFLAPFLDGGCAVHVTGTQLGAANFLIDADYGFAPDAATADAIVEALEANGYSEDPNFPGGFQTADQTRFAGVLPVGGEVKFTGFEATEQFYPDGVVFYG